MKKRYFYKVSFSLVKFLYSLYTYTISTVIYKAITICVIGIPIKINGAEITAKVQDIAPFLMGYRVHLSLGSYPIKEYIYFLKEFYDEFQKYEIEIVDGLNFTAAKYFDIRTNSWKLDKLVPSVLEANKLCREFSHKKL